MAKLMDTKLKQEKEEAAAVQSQVQAEQSDLILKYLAHEERTLGPNPNVEHVYDFQRQNLPRKLAFYGQPDFLPETIPEFPKMQRFILDARAQFVLKPFPAVDPLTLVNQYTLTFFVMGDGSNVPLFSAVKKDLTNGPVIGGINSSYVTLFGDNVSSSLISSNWNVVTFVVDIVAGLAEVYINAVAAHSLKDTEHNRLVFDGDYAIHPGRGVNIFPIDRPRDASTVVSLRNIVVSPKALTAEQVLELHKHSRYKMWNCSSCQKPVAYVRTSCPSCSTARNKTNSETAPDENPSMTVTDTNYAITIVVADNFQSKVVDVLEEGDQDILLLLYSKQSLQKRDAEILTLWRWLAKEAQDICTNQLGMATMPVVISMMNVDDNKLNEDTESLVPTNYAQTAPSIRLMRAVDDVVSLDIPADGLNPGALLDWLQAQIRRFSFEAVSIPCFQRYWNKHALSSRFSTMRQWLLRWRATSASQERLHEWVVQEGEKFFDPVRALSGYFLQDGTFTEDEGIPELQVGEFALGSGQYDSDQALESFFQAVMFPEDLPEADAKWVSEYSLNLLLVDIVRRLARELLKDPKPFITAELIKRPMVVSPDEPVPDTRYTPVDIRGVAPMMYSEITAQWPKVIAAVTVGETGSKEMQEVLEELLRSGFPVAAKPYGYSALHTAAVQGNLEAVKLLYVNGADLHQKAENDRNALELAASMGHADVVRFLIRCGSDFAGSLHCAAATGQISAVKEVLGCGVDPDACMETTPLEVAIIHGHLPAVTILVSQFGANKQRQLSPALQKRYNLTPGDDQATKQREEAGEEADSTGAYPSPTDLARHLKQTIIFRFLSKATNAREAKQSVMAYVQECLLAERIPKPVEGMDVDELDTHGWTALMKAALGDNGEIARALLHMGASLSIQNRRGFTAMMWAEWCDATKFKQAVVEVRGPAALQLTSQDHDGLERLNGMRNRALSTGNMPELRMLETDSFRALIGRLNKTSVSQIHQRQQDMSQTQPQFQEMLSEPLVAPTETTEELLRRLTKEGSHGFPGGSWGTDVEGFLASCRLFVQDLVASGQAQNVSLAQMFCLHLYTRSDADYFSFVNRIIREKQADAIAEWQPFIFHFSRGLKSLTRKKGLYYRGVRRYFSIPGVDMRWYLPDQIVTFTAVTSTSEDYRVATNFMYSKTEENELLGSVVFKIWSKFPTSIKMFSYFPDEEEYVFPPSQQFKVLNWYEASDVNVRRGAAKRRTAQDWIVDCDHIVQSTPLEVFTEKDDLDKQLHQVKVFVIEMKDM
eukprot:c32288_g1_i1.p1 GENE.c32288_g1_i1~~c32288_g1_i1.p1  ORF type:complete len:1295 (+),score=382.27 c32288_g1_i1:57-3887(+)